MNENAKDDIEDEINLLIKCPLYNEERTALSNRAVKITRALTNWFKSILNIPDQFLIDNLINVFRV